MFYINKHSHSIKWTPCNTRSTVNPDNCANWSLRKKKAALHFARIVVYERAKFKNRAGDFTAARRAQLFSPLMFWLCFLVLAKLLYHLCFVFTKIHYHLPSSLQLSSRESLQKFLSARKGSRLGEESLKLWRSFIQMARFVELLPW